MNPAISKQIADLPSRNRTHLLGLWAANFNTNPPRRLRQDLMVMMLAYRIQEREYGGLSHSARIRLREIAKTLPSKRPRAKEPATSTEKPTTRLIRIWHGEKHEVIVSEDGYLYKDQLFPSLSRIAREITGTNWSGPVFFGTKEKKAK